MINLLIILGIIAILTLMFYLGYLYGRISEKQTRWQKERRKRNEH